MSTSSVQAETDLSAVLPSCSHTGVNLDVDVLTNIFEKVGTIGNIRDVIKLTPLSSWAAYGIERALTNHSHIRVDIRAPVEFRITGLKKEKLPVPEPVIYIQMHLERLSLMMFDLGFDASQTAICDHFLEIARSGATFRHLSYTSFVGFDPTDDVVQTFLDRCQVRSLRLTMMRGPYIAPQPDYMVGKVRQIDHVELGEVVDKPNIFNSLVTYENVFKKVFPNVQDIHYFQHW
ncbi:hypothetical protein TELCIR_13082 [Teladorsagia circumcincta]|uniref:Uncharacterized protein n=1 Tax=Teladorsagia circumcincta TaxID=45464 RepID=A0A2G9U4Q6_TELCI|nr:hypothetical protein TELCIR_13082 [Teladorsagia circumcincta]